MENKIRLPLEKSKKPSKIVDIIVLIIIVLMMGIMTHFATQSTAVTTNVPTVQDVNLSDRTSLPTDGPATEINEIVVENFDEIILTDLIPSTEKNITVIRNKDLEDGAMALNTMVASANRKPSKEQTFNIVPVKTSNEYISKDSRKGFDARTTVKVKKRKTKSGKKVWSIKKVKRKDDCKTCDTVVVLSKRSKDALDLALDDSDGSIKTVRRVREIIKTFREQADKNEFVNDGTLVSEIATHYSQKNVDAIWATFYDN
jgi:hypothetical protein